MEESLQMEDYQMKADCYRAGRYCAGQADLRERYNPRRVYGSVWDINPTDEDYHYLAMHIGGEEYVDAFDEGYRHRMMERIREWESDPR